MRYLIIHPTGVFYTQWFDAENHFTPNIDMIVIDIPNHLYTRDGITWLDIDFDHL